MNGKHWLLDNELKVDRGADNYGWSIPPRTTLAEEAPTGVDLVHRPLRTLPMQTANPQSILSDACAMLRLLDRVLPPTGGAVQLLPSDVAELLDQARMLRESVRMFGDETRALALRDG